MNITERNWQPGNCCSDQLSVRFRQEQADAASDQAVDKASDDSVLSAGNTSGNSDCYVGSVSENTSDSSASGKMKSSVPDDSVGQLASELARAETKLDVLQVLSKATRALTNLKMSYYGCEGDDAKKVEQMIRRMEKLIKRIQKKSKQLAKEEEMELRQKKAEKQEKLQQAKQIREELRSKRNKRRREERNYALKEQAEDGKEAVKETISALAGAGSALSGSQTAFYDASGSIDLSAVSLDGMSIDVTV